MDSHYKKLKFRYPGITRGAYKKFTSSGAINRTTGEINIDLVKDILIQQYDPEFFNNLKAELSRLNIVAETEDYVAINKSEKLLTSGKETELSAQSILQLRSILEDTNPFVEIRPVHLLDKVTSGIVVFSKNLKGHEYFSQQFRKRQVKKTYFAVVIGDFKSYLSDLGQDKLLISSRISKKPVAGRYRSVLDSDIAAEEAITEVEFVKYWKSDAKSSLLRVKPLTGRTHQIRVHLSEQNFSIIGDVVYDGGVHERVMLHAKSLEFTTGEHFEASLPASFT